MWSKLPSPIVFDGTDSQLALHQHKLFVLLFASIIWAVWEAAPEAYVWSQAPSIGFSTTAPQESATAKKQAADAELPILIESPVSNHQRATQLVLNALRQCVWGPAVTCKIGQSVKLFDRQLTGYGQYAHAGQGTGKLKMSIHFAAGDQLNTFHQVSDGVVIYTYNHIGEASERCRVDLGRVRERLGVVTIAHLEDPVVAMYLGIGGQAEMLRKLCQQYRWVDVQPEKIDDKNVWWLTGELTSNPAEIRALAEIDTLLLKANISGLLPQHVRIALGRGEPMPLWLYRIEYSRSRPMQAVGDLHPLEAVMDFSEPHIVANMPVEMFLDDRAESSPVPPHDETNKYLPPSPVTAQRLPVLNRLR